jgi:hypothetical protein
VPLAKLAKPGQVFAPGLVKRLHVDQAAVKAGDSCCITIQNATGPWRCKEARIQGPSTLKASLDEPLPCGARVWIETHHAVEVVE